MSAPSTDSTKPPIKPSKSAPDSKTAGPTRKDTNSPASATGRRPRPRNDSPKTINQPETVAESKAGSARRGSQRGGRSGARGRGGAQSAEGGRSNSANQDSAQAPAADPDVALSSLKNIISELKDGGPLSSNSSTASSPILPASGTILASAGTASPIRTNPKPTGGRSNSNPRSQKKITSSPGPPTIVPPPPASSGPTSAVLNPNAGGFQPGGLGPIHDMKDEGLITPTASNFDLMTGLPHGAGGPGSVGSMPGFSRAGPTPGGGFVGSQGRFSFPGPGNQQHQQQQAAQVHAQIAAFSNQQQQAFLAQQVQLQQLAAGGFPGAGDALATASAQAAAVAALRQPGVRFAQSPGGLDQQASEQLMVEQMNIQRQLEALQLQQQDLIARFVEQQQQQQQQPDAPSPRQANPHQRRQSGQQSSFSGMGNFGQPGTFGTLPPQASPAGTKSHARRHSVKVQTGSAPGTAAASQALADITSPASATNTFSSPLGGHGGGFGSFGGSAGGGFTFPPNSNRQAHQGHNQRDSFSGFNDEGYGSAGGNGNGNGFGHQRRQSSISSLAGWNVPVSAQAPLAEAQAHLSQLAAYRASSGHARVPSFGMSQGGGAGPGQLAMASYGGGIGAPGQNNQMRKSLFAPYLPQASIGPLLAAGKLVMGTLRVNKRNRSDAYISTDVLDADVYVCGSKDRNRALEGDVVVVELLEVDEVWGTKKDKEAKKAKKEESSSFDPRATRNQRRQAKAADDVEVEGQGLLLMQDEEVSDETKPQYAGHVVAVIERAPGQLFTGQLGVLRPSSAATAARQESERREREGVDLRANQNGPPQPPPRIVWFRSSDKRVPLIAIPTEQAPPDFVDNSEAYQNKIFVACIKRWPISSLHPFGTLVEELGPIGDIETETAALLKDCNFSTDPFTDSVIKCLPQTPWTVPEREAQPEVRKDLRDHRVFTIDPETARDLDDALHVKKLDDGNFEVGVHIADVSHFVKPNNALDREARKRATTVYLVQRAVPMLPPTLCEHLCSLNPGVDKLTFSVIFTLTPDGKVVSTWFGKTLINSKVKLAYEDAQEVIEGKALPARRDIDDRDGVQADILMLAGIAKHMRHRRFEENGALKIDNVKVVFGLDEHGMPEDCHAFQRKEANEMIEEFMLLANMAVAGKIASGLPDQALLRRHEAPIDRRLDAFAGRMKRLGIEIDSSSAGSIMHSFSAVTDLAEKATLQHLSTKSMQRAKYFCTGMLDISKYHHYALNVPLYTHFTSPIRRYADIIVHRQLEAILQANPNAVEGPRFGLDAEAVSKIAQTCNMRKDAAKLAQEQSAHLFLCVLISDLTARYGPVIRQGTVIGVLDEAFDVLVQEFGIEKRVHADNIPTEKIEYDEATNSLELHWKKGVNVLDWLADSQNDAHLQKVKHQAEHHAKMMGADSGRAAEEEKLFEDDDEDEGEGEGEKGLHGNWAAELRRKKMERSEQHRKSTNNDFKFDGVDATRATQTVRELQTGKLACEHVALVRSLRLTVLVLLRSAGLDHVGPVQVAADHQGSRRQPVRRLSELITLAGIPSCPRSLVPSHSLAVCSSFLKPQSNKVFTSHATPPPLLHSPSLSRSFRILSQI